MRYVSALWGNVKVGDSQTSKLVNQTDHGFTFGACIKRDGAGNWILAKADTRANAGTVGIVCEIIDADHFRYITGGLLAGEFVDGADYWLSTTTAGAIFIQSDPEVWEIGNVREFIGTGTANGLEVEIDVGDEIVEMDFQTDGTSTRLVEIIAIRDTDSLNVGDKLATWTIPDELNGYKLTRAEAAIKTASTSGVISIMIRNVTTANDMLSTPVTIDATELNSYIAATKSVINSSANTVATGNTVSIDVDAVGTGTKGLNVMLTFVKA